jgi:predicted transcriptional regulator
MKKYGNHEISFTHVPRTLAGEHSATSRDAKIYWDRSALGISQSRLARLSGVSRFKIWTFELGSGLLNAEEQRRIRLALEAEAGRLRSVAERITLDGIELGEPQ